MLLKKFVCNQQNGDGTVIFGNEESEDLNIGMILAHFQSEGIVHECCKSCTAQPITHINWLIVMLSDLDCHVHVVSG